MAYSGLWEGSLDDEELELHYQTWNAALEYAKRKENKKWWQIWKLQSKK